MCLTRGYMARDLVQTQRRDGLGGSVCCVHGVQQTRFCIVFYSYSAT